MAAAAGATSGGKRARAGPPPPPPPRERRPHAPRAARRQEQPAPRPDELEGRQDEGEGEVQEEAPQAGRGKLGSTPLSTRALLAVESSSEDEDEGDVGGYERPLAPGHGPARANASRTPLSTRAVRAVESEEEDDADDDHDDHDGAEEGEEEEGEDEEGEEEEVNASRTPLSTRAVRAVESEEEDDADDDHDDHDGAEEGEEEEGEEEEEEEEEGEAEEGKEEGEAEEGKAETRSPGRGGNAASRSAMTPLSTRAVRSGDSDEEGVLQADKVAGIGGQVKRRGVVYISRPPVFMKPAKVRLLLGQHGAVTNLYLAPEDASIRKSRFKRGGSRKIKFTEGWVEFESRAAAKHVAGLLHGQRIGGKRGNFHYDDLWSLKYLSGFQWSHLSEKAAYERRVKSVRLRAELASAKRENEFYLEKVAQSKRIKAIVSNKQQRGRALAPEEEGFKRQFKQLESQEAYSKAKRARLGGGETVLDNVFT
jgi:ESF2/ABP1 family protein